MAAPLSSAGPVRSSDTASAAAQIAELTAELQQREQLIEVLTERLEEAAEQLDRFHRSGADRALQAGGGRSSSSEVLERLGGLSDGLEQMVVEWQQVQGAAILQQLDLRMEQIIDYLRGGGEPAPAEPQSHSSGTAHAPKTAEQAPATVSEPTAPQPAAVEEEPPLELKSAPDEIGDTETDAAKLLAGVRAREEYISYLIRELHRRRPRQPIDWAALQSCPEQLTGQLQKLEQRLQSELQREELNLSLERARMARERAELDKIRARLEKEIRTMGRAQPAETVADAPKPEDNARLFRLFGRKR